jgi:hypothetical protein
MPLDIALLRETGEPECTVSISVETHARLMAVIRGEEPQLSRLHDYYADVDYSCAEIEALLVEVEGVLARTLDPDVRGFLLRVRNLAEEALGRGSGLVVIAD